MLLLKIADIAVTCRQGAPAAISFFVMNGSSFWRPNACGGNRSFKSSHPDQSSLDFSKSWVDLVSSTARRRQCGRVSLASRFRIRGKGSRSALQTSRPGLVWGFHSTHRLCMSTVAVVGGAWFSTVLKRSSPTSLTWQCMAFLFPAPRPVSQNRSWHEPIVSSVLRSESRYVQAKAYRGSAQSAGKAARRRTVRGRDTSQR